MNEIIRIMAMYEEFIDDDDDYLAGNVSIAARGSLDEVCIDVVAPRNTGVLGEGDPRVVVRQDVLVPAHVVLVVLSQLSLLSLLSQLSLLALLSLL